MLHRKTSLIVTAIVVLGTGLGALLSRRKHPKHEEKRGEKHEEKDDERDEERHEATSKGPNKVRRHSISVSCDLTA